LIGNSNKLVQVFDNLIDNSLSIVGKNCKINIRAFSKGKKIFILFEDNGPGFPKNAINKIFDRFYTDRINQKEFGKHSGLGLSISKQIISAHNGDIFAENIINHNKKIIGARVNIILNK
jgi:two-component system sensor histidine kinase ChvG